MENDKGMAKEMCKDLGIKWDSTATAPLLNGVPLTDQDISALFYDCMEDVIDLS